MRYRQNTKGDILYGPLVTRRSGMYIRRFRNDRTRFEESQKRVGKGGDIVLGIYSLCDNIYPFYLNVVF